ncbi:MAG: zinc-dependent alcohol dehydrogenase family protein [Desulfobacteraceae bacterium]|nr:zinc-dependent alcohol dehydrogenase family protein [Desulfobacteraceae bacterium]
MVIDTIGPVTTGSRPLAAVEMPVPVPGVGEILIRVAACGVCHTELDEIEGRTPPPRLPVVPGHQVVGRVAALGPGAGRFREGERVGVAWIFSACGTCGHCRAGNENLCARFRATGRDADGGYAGYMKVPEAFAFKIPAVFADAEAAPLLCAGGVGFRSLRLTGLKDGQRLGLTGFGASAHLVLKLVRHHYPAAEVFVFARSPREREFARELGAVWAGDTLETSPEPLDAIIDTTPAWKPVVAALGQLKPGGRLVINAIRKEAQDREELLGLDYATHLWMEKRIQSVANVARGDVAQFLQLAAAVPLRPEVQTYPLAAANQALVELKTRKIRGAKVLLMA